MSLNAKLHRYAAVALSIFVLLHLFNHLLAWSGIALHRQFLDSFRLIYRHPVGETILLLLIAVQVISGFVHLRKQVRPLSATARWQRYAGLYLILFLIGHTTAIQVGRYGLKLDTDFYFGSIVLLDPYSRWLFVPYYTLGVLAFFVHLGIGLSWSLPERYRSPLPKIAAVLGLLVALAIILVFGGWVYDIPLLPAYQKVLLF